MMFLQIDIAKQVLKAAIQRQHAGLQISKFFTRAIGCAAIDLGLEPSPTQAGFELMPVPFTRIGDLVAKMRKHPLQPSKKLKNNIRELDLEHIISFSELKGERYLTINMQVLLPNPGNSVKDLLPGVVWPPVTGPPCTSQTSHSTSNLETVIPAKTTTAGGSGSGSGSSSSRNQAAAASSATPLVAPASSIREAG